MGDDKNHHPPAKKKRSRSGCKNCRLRGVKCDEVKPECKRCLSYGVVCSYDKKTATENLQFFSEQEMVMTGNLQVSPENWISKQIPYWPTRADELLNKFQLITAPTVSVGPRTQLYRTSVIERARTSPYIFHALMALTLMHLRSLTAGANAGPTREEAEHCYKAVSLFAKEVVVAANVQSSKQQGTLLCASALIYNMAFANIEAKTPEEAWPLAPSSPVDLGWLKISNAKQKVSALAIPIGSDPLFTTLSSSFGPEIEACESISAQPSILPLGFVNLFGLASRNLENPYFSPAIELGRIFGFEDVVHVTLGWIHFVNEVSDAFKDLLYQKDPRALLLLACWFSKLSNMPVWWYRHRAVLEGKAICLYLEKCDVGDLNFQVLLRLVKGRFFSLPAWDVYPRDVGEFVTNPVHSMKFSSAPSEDG